MTKQAKTDKNMTLEEAFVQLEATVARLEKEDSSLEDSFIAYQQGMELLKFCNGQIDKVEKKVLVIDEAGALVEADDSLQAESERPHEV
ncbi:MAG: exodeoxyribonuclease VII small subunit [Lachnospiraceae bacterium]